MAKWVRQKSTESGISADAVTGDLRTRDNSLSCWRCKPDAKDDIDQVALAIAAASDRLGTVDIVWLQDNDLESDGQNLKHTEGQTPLKDLAGRHIDICDLDYDLLGKVAKRVAAAVKDKQCHRLTKPRIKQLLVSAIEQNRIAPENLSDKIRKELV